MCFFSKGSHPPPHALHALCEELAMIVAAGSPARITDECHLPSGQASFQNAGASELTSLRTQRVDARTHAHGRAPSAGGSATCPGHPSASAEPRERGDVEPT